MTRILVIDHSQGVRERVRGALTGAELCDELLEANDAAGAMEILSDQEVDLILCDVVGGQGDGFNFLSRRAKQERLHRVPVIIMTGTEHADARVRGLESGAADFLTKPFRDEELVARVRTHVTALQLRDELKDRTEEVEQITQVDKLTGLSSRRHLMNHLELEFARAGRYGRTMSFVMADLDHFKVINAQHGSEAGDTALTLVGAAFREAIRDHDVVGRYGGEEFGIVLPETNLEGALLVAERCRTLVEETEIANVNLSISCGVACRTHEDGESPYDLIRRADEALLEAKVAGRNRVVASD